ncbi:MAG TPA: hypothetical protein VFC10_04185 [Terriglobia bacterium]|nr:hypothetical protein [Terriglobia bacterium]
MGFLVASGWIIYSFVTPPDILVANMQNPFVEALAFTTCPFAIAGRYFPLRFWWVAPANAASYAVIGLIVEMLRRELNPPSLPDRST